MKKPYDLSGQKFGKLTALSYSRSVNANAHWLCKCDCGNSCEVAACHLKNGHTTSCGCVQRAVMRAMKKTHGHTIGRQSATYRSWLKMKSRCENPRNLKYPEYGGRGITVCRRWRKFENFLADMGERPRGRTLDRLDGNKGYSRRNCRWATARQQRLNRRVTKHG